MRSGSRGAGCAAGESPRRRRDDVRFAAAAKADDDFQRVEFGEALLELGDLRGAPPIVDVIAHREAAQARKDAWEHLRAHLPIPQELHEPAGSELEAWWKENEKRLVPDHAGVFKLAP